jgi:hypothetical protein
VPTYLDRTENQWAKVVGQTLSDNVPPDLQVLKEMGEVAEYKNQQEAAEGPSLQGRVKRGRELESDPRQSGAAKDGDSGVQGAIAISDSAAPTVIPKPVSHALDNSQAEFEEEPSQN